MATKPALNVVLFVSALLLSATSAQAQTDQPVAPKSSVEDFLIENGLSRLLLTHRESQVDNSAEDRAQQLEKLNRAYSVELFKPITDGDVDWAEQLLVKAKTSLAANPTKKAERLRLAIVHREVELLRREYLTGSTSIDADRIVDDLNSLGRGVKQQVENLERLTELQQTKIGDDVRLNELRQQSGHGEYLLGWSYFLQSAIKRHQEKQVLRDAESYFRSFLDLDPHLNLTKFPADNFGKRNRFQRSATLGLSLVMQAIGSRKQAEHCFAIAEEHAKSSANSNREIENFVRWKFVGLLDRDDSHGATAMLVDQPELAGDAVLTDAILNRPDAGPEFIALAMIELALSFKGERLRETIQKHPETFSRMSDVEPWMRGYLAWNDYQKNDTPEMLRRAMDQLQKAVENFNAETRPAIEGHCRFLLASCMFEQSRFANAAQDFLVAMKLLHNNSPDLAAESAYRAFQSKRLLPAEQRQHADKIAAHLIAGFPQSSFARLAEFDLSLDRLKNVPSQDAIVYLEQYRTTNSPSSVRSAATVEIARRYRMLADDSNKSFREFVATVASDNRISSRAKAETHYQYLSTLLAQDNVAAIENEIDRVLSELESLLNSPDAKGPKRSEAARYIYFQTLVLRKLHPEDQSRAFEYFQQTQTLKDSSPWTLATTIETAKFFEDVPISRLATEPLLRKRIIEVFSSLLSGLAPTDTINREIAAVKLAKLYLADGQIEAARLLTEGVSEDATWLPVLASLAEKENNPSGSESLWQQLEQLLPTGSDGWWEARLNRLSVLHRLDAGRAEELLNSTIALYPETPQTFSDRLQALSEQWGAE